MPTDDDRRALEQAKRDEEQGKSPSTQAGEFVREEIDHVREGKHGARNAKQAIAIGLSKARRAGIKLPPPKRGSSKIRRQAERDLSRGRAPRKVSKRRSHATENALRRESSRSVSPQALSKRARQGAQNRGSTARQQAAEKAAHTKGKSELQRAARKAARSRRRAA